MDGQKKVEMAGGRESATKKGKRLKTARNLFYIILIALSIWALFLISARSPGNYFQLLFNAMELRTLDYRYTMRAHTPEARKDIVIIAMDEKSFESISDPWLLWAPYIVDTMEMLQETNARVIALDILLGISYEDYFPGHPDLNSSMKKALSGGKVVIISMPMVDKIMWPYGPFATAAGLQNIAVALGEPDSDGIVRRAPIFFSTGEASYLTFPILLASKYLGAPPEPRGKDIYMGDRRIENEQGRLLINYAGPPMTFRNISFSDVLEKVREKDEAYFRENFKDKIVFIGVTFPGWKDIYDTPYKLKKEKEMSGTEIVANALNTILTEDYIVHPDLSAQSIILLAVCLIVALLSYLLRPVMGAVASASVIAIFVVSSFILFDHASIWINITVPCLAFPLVYGGVYVYRYITELREKKILKDIFGKMASGEVVDEIVDRFDEIMERGEEKKITILFSDINNFSTISEKLKPERLLELLNENFNEMVDIVIKNRGIVNKFVGDEIMVVYGAPRPEERQAYLAVKTAIEMIKRLREMKKEGGEGFYEVKIGIHTGNVITGFLGSRKRLEYAVIGDNVNLASRIEGLNKSLSSTILISEDTYRDLEKSGSKLNAQFINKGPQKVKGRQEEIVVYEVIV